MFFLIVFLVFMIFIIKQISTSESEYSGDKDSWDVRKNTLPGNRYSDKEVRKLRIKTIDSESSHLSDSPAFFSLEDMSSENWRMNFFNFSVDNLELAQAFLGEIEGKVSPSDLTDFYRLFAQAFGSQDIAAAIDWARNLEKPGLRNECLKGAFNILIQNENLDVLGKLNLIKDFKDNEWSSGYFASILTKVDASNAEIALDWVNNSLSGDPILYYASVANVLSRVGIEDSQKYINMMTSLEYSNGIKDSVIASIRTISFENPEKALEIIDALNFDPELQQQTIGIAIEKSIVNKGAEWTMNYLKNSYPDDKERIFSSSMGNWIEIDPESALQWVRDLDSVSQNQFYSNDSMILKLGNKMPEKTLDEIISLEGNGGVVDTIIRDWSYSRPEEAAQWISRADISTQEIHIKAFVEGIKRESPKIAIDYINSLGVDSYIKDIAVKSMKDN